MKKVTLLRPQGHAHDTTKGDAHDTPYAKEKKKKRR